MSKIYVREKCRHMKDKSCWSKKTSVNDIIVRGYCIFCLFDGKEFEDEWDSLAEALLDIAMTIYNLGNSQGMKGQRSLYPCKSKCANVQALYEFYKLGYHSGVDYALKSSYKPV